MFLTINLKKILIVVVSFIVITIIFFPKKDNKKSLHRHRNAIAVKTTLVSKRAIPMILKAAGTVEAENSVAVTAQASGIVKQVLFKEGQEVTQGQLLFVIDQTTYRAALNQALAVLRRDQAQLKLAEANEQRYASLVKLEYVTRQQYEEAVANTHTHQANVAADQALVDQAQAQLDFTEIHAPVTGLSGGIAVKVGNFVQANSSTPLVTINQMQNMLVTFKISQKELQQLLYFQKLSGNLPVEISHDDFHHQVTTGELQFIDNKISNDTASVLLKAQVSNSHLWPGELVGVQVILTTQQNALVIPANAVQLDQKGSFVYVITENKVSVQHVTVSRYFKDLAVIQNGLELGTRVVSVVTPGLRAGSTIVSVP